MKRKTSEHIMHMPTGLVLARFVDNEHLGQMWKRIGQKIHHGTGRSRSIRSGPREISAEFAHFPQLPTGVRGEEDRIFEEVEEDRSIDAVRVRMPGSPNDAPVSAIEQRRLDRAHFRIGPIDASVRDVRTQSGGVEQRMGVHKCSRRAVQVGPLDLRMSADVRPKQSPEMTKPIHKCIQNREQHG